MLIDQGMEDSKHTAENGGRKGSFGRLNWGRDETQRTMARALTSIWFYNQAFILSISFSPPLITFRPSGVLIHTQIL